jgi:hypothetical protein
MVHTTLKAQRDRVLAGGIIAGAGGFLVALGALLPWITASAAFASFSANGMQGGGDGIWLLVIGVVILAMAIVAIISKSSEAAPSVVIIILGLIGGVVMAIDLGEINDRINTAKSQSDLIVASVGAGVFVVFVGAALAIGGAILLLTSRGAARTSPSAIISPPGKEPFAPVANRAQLGADSVACPICRSSQEVSADASAYTCEECGNQIRFLRCPGCSTARVVPGNVPTFKCAVCGTVARSPESAASS